MNIAVRHSSGKQELAFREGQTIFDVLVDAGIAVDAVCGGHGTCGRCLVQLGEGTDAPWRLACQEPARDGMTVSVPERSPLVVQQRGSSKHARRFAITPESPIALGGKPYADGGTNAAAAYGLAIDIGTTTVVAHLHDLATGKRLATAGRVNPQASFGADVISRISASMDGKLSLMTERIVDALQDMRAQVCAQAGIDPALCTVASVAGNTVMGHIFVGLPPDSIGASPFEPLSKFGDAHDIANLGVCYVVPAVAGYVGGDIVAGLLACGYGDETIDSNQASDIRLFLDLGTNGEMALSVNGSIACCATAAGPVFEGAGIACGMPATAGAISHVRIEGGSVSIQTVDNAAPVGICGTGIVDAVAALLNSGVVDETGLMLDDDEVDGVYAARLDERDGYRVFYLTDDRSVYISQKDVRNVQLAKAAVAGGVYTLMDYFGITPDDIDAVEIAGGFGAFIDVESAARIGLFPAQLRTRATSVGNTAAEGASMTLLSAPARDFAAKLACECHYIELSTSQEFNTFYVEQMAFEE